MIALYYEDLGERLDLGWAIDVLRPLAT